MKKYRLDTFLRLIVNPSFLRIVLECYHNGLMDTAAQAFDRVCITSRSLLKIPFIGSGESLRSLNRSDSDREAPGVGWFPLPTPLKSPLSQGTLFSSNVVPQCGMKNSLGNLGATGIGIQSD